MTTFTLPLPPCTNHAYRSGQGRVYRSPELCAWQDEAAVIVGQWAPPAKTPLRVTIALVMPRLYASDIDGRVKACLDAVVGKHSDQYVVEMNVTKRKGPVGLAGVTVEVIA